MHLNTRIKTWTRVKWIEEIVKTIKTTMIKTNLDIKNKSLTCYQLICREWKAFLLACFIVHRSTGYWYLFNDLFNPKFICCKNGRAELSINQTCQSNLHTTVIKFDLRFKETCESTFYEFRVVWCSPENSENSFILRLRGTKLRREQMTKCRHCQTNNKINYVITLC